MRHRLRRTSVPSGLCAAPEAEKRGPEASGLSPTQTAPDLQMRCLSGAWRRWHCLSLPIPNAMGQSLDNFSATPASALCAHILPAPFSLAPTGGGSRELAPQTSIISAVSGSSLLMRLAAVARPGVGWATRGRMAPPPLFLEVGWACEVVGKFLGVGGGKLRRRAGVLGRRRRFHLSSMFAWQPERERSESGRPIRSRRRNRRVPQFDRASLALIGVATLQ